MRKLIAITALAFTSAWALSACNQDQKDTAEVQTAAEVVVMPTSATDKAAWKKYLVSVVTGNMQGMTSRTPYMYFVPGGEDDVAVTDRGNQLENVSNVVARGVVPGNMMAFGGPDSAKTADLILEAFKDVQAGAFKGVIILFIGAQTDADRVKQALVNSGAEFRFVEMK
ncbi:MAG TPA: hypothetical protein VFG55_00830 [Rhodanobacteraceae bacterium]|nr:hypothetical protein [Rhodanobacteraceae bacterium]